MNNLKILLKNNINLFVGNFKTKTKQKSYTLAVFFLVLGIIAITALYSYQAYIMYDGLNKIGLGKVCVFHGILTSLSVIVIIGLMRVSDSREKDADFLLSLPIKKSSIIISKTINRYIFDLFFAFILFLPYSILYLIYAGFDILILIRSLCIVFFLPLLSVGISYIFDFIVTRLFNKFKSGKLLKSLFSVLIFVVVLALMLIKTSTYGTVDPANLELYFNDRFFSNMILEFVLDGTPISTIFFFSLTLIPFVLGLIMCAFNFGKNFVGYSKVSNHIKFDSPKSEFKRLYQKEVSTYLTTVSWIVNTIIGPIMMLALAILICAMGAEKVLAIFGFLEGVPPYAIFAIILCAIMSASQISCCSVSLEGKQFWILKTSPINEKKLLSAKAFFNFTICEPFILISSILISAVLKINFTGAIILFSLPTTLNLISSFGGVLINIYFPILEFENETKVVKQSFSVLLTMVLTFLLTIIPIGLFFIFKNLPIAYILLISFMLYFFVLALILSLLFTKGVKKFRTLGN